MTMLGFAANVPGIVPNVGYFSRGALTNKQTAYNANPPHAPGTQEVVGGVNTIPHYTTVGDPAGVFSVVDDMAQLRSAGLYGDGKPSTNGLVYKLDNSAGTSAFGVSMNGPTGNTNLHTASVYARGGTGNQTQFLSLAPMTGGTFPASETYVRRVASFTPASATSIMHVVADPGQIVHFILNQLVEGAQAGPVIVAAGAATSVGADALYFGSPITGDEDFIAWVAADYRLAATAGTNERPFAFDDGTANNRLWFQRINSSGAFNAAFVVAGGAPVTIAAAGAQPSAGRAVSLLRRRGGSYTVFSKDSSGTMVTGAEQAGPFPDGINRISVGSLLGSNQPGSPIEFVGLRKGNFADADIMAILQAA